MNGVYIWLIVLIFFSVLEACTVALVSIWFAIGALAALISAALGLQPAGQIIVFLVCSAVCLAATCKLVKERFNPQIMPTNTDKLIGEKAVVCESIDNINGAGAVKVDGKIWTARSADGFEIPLGTVVRITKIDGVKLIVENISD